MQPNVAVRQHSAQQAINFEVHSQGAQSGAGSIEPPGLLFFAP